MSTRTKDLKKKNNTQNITKEEMMSDIKKYGYLKKLKTMKKKYFVLRAESQSGPARLEYYDSEKKWKTGLPPKRSITLKTCFNINRKLDSKQKNVIALYTRDDCFAIVTENEGELEQWLMAMLELQHGIIDVDGDATPKPTFEHVWQVSVKSKGLGSSKNISGTHRLCLTAKSLSLVKMNPHCDKQEILEFPLMSIRRCGHSECFFFMELGRSSVTGAGELWMLTEDTVIAQNMHEAILGAMKSSRNREELGPLPRPRSASTSENPTKPITSRHPGSSSISQTMGSNIPSMSSSARERCDSMPSRSRTVSEGHQDMSCSPHSRGHYTSSVCPGHLLDTPRPHTIYGRTVSYSPPSNNPLSPSGICSSSSSLSFEELESSLPDFRRFPHTLPGENPVQTEPTITEEANDNEYLMMAPGEEHSTESANYMSLPKYDHSSLFLNLASSPEDVLSISQTESTGDYLEMASPSLLSQPEGYMTMSAVGSLTVDVSNSSPTRKTLVTDLTSTAELPKGFDGYVPMAPVLATVPTDLPLHTISSPSAKQEGYLDMTPLSSSLPKAVSHMPGSQYLEMSSPTFICQEDQASHSHLSSVGTQEEFHLDKVKSYFSPSEDDSDDYIKPVRAYSIGSRPQLRKSHLTTHLESRVRAYSVGSQASSSAKKGLSGIESELGTMKNIDSRAAMKSCSAPLLPSGMNRHRTSSSRGEYGEDLMEIDYNQPSSHSRGKVSSSSQESIDHSRRFPVGSGRQRSNSRSSSGTSPMSSLMELSEKPEKNHGKVTAENKVQGENFISKILPSKTTSMEPVTILKSGNSDTPDNTKSPSVKSPVTELHKTSPNSGNNTFILESDTIDKPEALPNPSGDYVNLDFSCTNPSSTVSNLAITGKQSLQHNSALHLESIASTKNSAMHDYINVHLGGISSRNQPPGASSNTVAAIPLAMKSDYTIMAPVQTSCEHSSQLSNSLPVSEVSTTKNSSQSSHSPSLIHGGNKSPSLSSGTSSGGHSPSPSTRSPQSFLTFRKQISAPTAPVCLRADPPSPGRKSSCPVTSSFTSVISPTSMVKPILPASPSVNTQVNALPDHGVSNVVESNLEQCNSVMMCADGLPVCSQDKNSEVTYENVSIGSGSVPNSRPSSISSDRELNYASLDLAPSASDDDKAPRPSRNSKPTQQTTESYAEIDFTKSEGLRNTSGSLREGRV